MLLQFWNDKLKAVDVDVGEVVKRFGNPWSVLLMSVVLPLWLRLIQN
jgi:hypothetical protein